MVLPLWKTVQWFLKKLKIELPYDPAIPFLHIYPKELKARSQTDICTLMFTTAKMWKQPKHPPTNEWIKKKWYIHTIGYYSALKRKEILTYAIIWMMWYDWEFVCQQGTRVWSLVWEDFSCCGATKTPWHNYWAHAQQLQKPPGPRALGLWQEKPPQSEVCAGYN